MKESTNLGPIGLTVLIGIILIVSHYLLLRRIRRSKSPVDNSLVIMGGSLIIPMLILIGMGLSYYLFDIATGQNWRQEGGYTVLPIILYPILLPIYWTTMWLIDRKLKRKYEK